ncbi:MAG: MAPEG family protein [Sphingorhabdus sp.]
MTLPVTALTAAICALLLIILMFKTIGERLRTETNFGTVDDERFAMVRGAHGNLAENAPLAIIMLGVLELANAHHMALTGLAALFLVSRVLHAFGMFQHQAGKTTRFRQAGVLGSALSMAAMALWIIYLFVTVNL